MTPECKKCGTWIPCVDCFNKQTTDKPPAPDAKVESSYNRMAPTPEQLYADAGMHNIEDLGPDWLRNCAAQLLQPFLYTGRFNEPPIERVREILQAVKDYVLEVKP